MTRLAVLATLRYLGALELLRRLVAPDPFRIWPGSVLPGGLVPPGVRSIPAAIFGVVGRPQARLARQNRESLALHAAGLGILGALEPETVAQRAVDGARDLVGARNGARSILGKAGASRRSSHGRLPRSGRRHLLPVQEGGAAGLDAGDEDHGGVAASATCVFDDAGRTVDAIAGRDDPATGRPETRSTPITADGDVGAARIPTEGTGVWQYDTDDHGDSAGTGLRITGVASGEAALPWVGRVPPHPQPEQ